MHQAKALADVNWNRAKDFQHSYSNSDKLQIWPLILKVGIVCHSNNLILGWRKKKRLQMQKLELLHQEKIMSAF